MSGESLIEYDYAIVRVVPRVHRAEFLNVGVVLHARQALQLLMRVSLDETRLRALDPEIDLAMLCSTLDAWQRVAQGGAEAGPIGLLTPSERFHWFTAPRSSILQTSPVHPGRCNDLDQALDELMREQVGEG